ncbi:Amino acid transporter AVT1I, partial [Glycine soja]
MSEELSCKSSLDVPLLPQWNHLDEKANIASHHSTKNTIVSLFAPALMDSMQYQDSLSSICSCIRRVVKLGSFVFYCHHNILHKHVDERCMDKNSNIKTYPNIGELAFGKTGRLIISVSMYMELYLVSTGFLILEGDNLSNLFPIGEIQIAGLAIGGKQLFVILVTLIILPTVWLDNLSMLSYVSTSGVFASAFIILSISWTATFDGVGFHQKGTLVNWNGIPTAVSLYAFCYRAHPVFPTLYNPMTNKHQFSYVLFACFLLTTVGYASMAIICYLMYGSHIESRVTLNLPLNKNKVTSILGSTVLVMSTAIVALIVPFFGDLMSLVGAFLSIMASILLPCLCYLEISGTYKKF